MTVTSRAVRPSKGSRTTPPTVGGPAGAVPAVTSDDRGLGRGTSLVSYSAIPVLLTLLGTPPEVPQSVRVETSVETWRAQAVADDVSRFLAARIQEAWSPDTDAEEPQFDVRLRWPGPEQVNIRVAQGARTWVDRPLPVDDPAAARAMVWLLVRSTIERALVHAALPPPSPAPVAPIQQTPPIPRPVSDPGPAEQGGVEVALADEDKDAAWLAAPEAPAKVETASVAEAPPPPTPPRTPDRPAPPAATSSAGASAAGGRQHGLRRLWSAPFSLGPRDAVEAALVMRGFADPGSGFGWGPAAQARLLLEDHLVLGGELGYRAERKGSDVEVDHVPVTLLAGYRFDESIPLEIGATATLDARFVTVTQTDGANQVDTTGVALGILLGTYARSFYPLWQKADSELRLFGEVGAGFGLLRSAYVVDGQREEDAVVTFSTGVGLEWRWR